MMKNESMHDCASPPLTRRPSEIAWAAMKERLFTRSAVSGVAVSASPAVVFVIANSKGSLIVGIVAATITAAVAMTYRIVRRESILGALVGVGIVAACATVAALTGQAQGFFLLPTVVPFLVIIVCVSTVAAGRPLSGLVLNRVAGGPHDWRQRTELRRVYTISTMAFVAVNTVIAALQVPLYLYGDTSILAASHVVTQPLYLAIVAVTVVFARRTAASTRRSPSNESDPTATPGEDQ
jgi:hypothetical protein